MWNKQNDVWIWKAQKIQIGNQEAFASGFAHFISKSVTKLKRIKWTLYRREADANHLTATSGRLRTDFHVFNAFWETMPPLDSQETHHMAPMSSFLLVKPRLFWTSQGRSGWLCTTHVWLNITGNNYSTTDWTNAISYTDVWNYSSEICENKASLFIWLDNQI